MPDDTGFDRLVAAAKTWLTTGNVPVKVGLIVLFFGVAFLLKYAVDNELFRLPIELRLFSVAAIGVVLLILGWRLQDRSRVYALNLQGGGIGVLYLTIFAAFRLYDLLPATFAFALLVVLTIGGGVLAVVQNARGLAVMASVGGFLAPVLVSTGQGSHVALFSYYLLINTAILGISWYRAWRSLNLIGFAFTFGIGTLWGFEYYRPELYASTQPFLILNFLFYNVIAVLFAFRQKPALRGLVDGTIIFGTPVIAFSLQAQLVADTEYGLAVSAGAVALFYAAVAVWIARMHSERLRLLMQSFAVLGVGFATLAVPLALDDRWSAITWALEGAAVVWIGVRQRGVLARVGGTLLIFAAGYFYLEHGWIDDLGWPLLNGNVLGGAIISLSALLAARLLRLDEHELPFQAQASVALLVWGAGWWFGTGAAEIEDRLTSHEPDVFVLFMALSAAALAGYARRDTWLAARRLTFVYLPLLVPVGFAYVFDADHFLTGWGWLTWPVALAANYVILWCAEGRSERAAPYLHALSFFAVAGVLVYEAGWWAYDAGLRDVWRIAASLTALLAASAAVLASHRRVDWPLARYRMHYLGAAGTAIFLQLIALLLLSFDNPGNPVPLPYVPLLNPFDMLTIAGIALGAWFLLQLRTLDVASQPDKLNFGWLVLGGLAFTLSTIAVVRGVHHFGDVSWNGFALRRSTSVQAALSIYWAILGVVGMVVGTRRAHYWIWLVGVGLMVLVVLKLFFVDLGNSGTLARIVSFLGVGVLLLVVGYFAPRPPRPGSTGREAQASG